MCRFYVYLIKAHQAIQSSQDDNGEWTTNAYAPPEHLLTTIGVTAGDAIGGDAIPPEQLLYWDGDVDSNRPDDEAGHRPRRESSFFFDDIERGPMDSVLPTHQSGSTVTSRCGSLGPPMPPYEMDILPPVRIVHASGTIAPPRERRYV